MQLRKRIGPIVFALGIVSLFNDIASEMVLPLLPAFIASIPGGGAFVIGLMEGVGESISAFLKLGCGYLSDKIKKRNIFLFIGYGIASISRPSIGFSTHALHTVLLRISDRIGKGIRTSPRDALLSDSVSEKWQGMAFSFHRAMDHTGAFIGPAAAIILIEVFSLNIRHVIFLSLIPGALAILPLFYVSAKTHRIGNEAGKSLQMKTAFKAKGFSMNFYLYIFTCFLFTIGNSSDLFLIYRAGQVGVKLYLLPALWATVHVSKILFSVPAGYISDKVGRKKPIWFGWLIYFITYLLFPYVKSSAGFFTIFFFYGLYSAFTEGVEKAFVSDLVTENRRGSAFGMYNFAVAVGALPSSLLMGVLYQWKGAEAGFGFGAGVALVSSILLMAVREKTN